MDNDTQKKQKNGTAFDLIVPPVLIKTERLTVTDILKSDKGVYAKLYKDDKVNALYGYDYREDLGDNLPTEDYFFDFFNRLKAGKEEYSLAVRKNGEIIGEIVLYNFTVLPEKSLEIGFRFFTDSQGKGFAKESVSAVIGTIKRWGFNRVVCKHLKENAKSQKLINALGFLRVKEDEKYIYYKKNLN